jgi:hypothetical protein
LLLLPGTLPAQAVGVVTDKAPAVAARIFVPSGIPVLQCILVLGDLLWIWNG